MLYRIGNIRRQRTRESTAKVTGLLRVNPGVRSRQLGRDVRKEDPQRLAVRRTAVFRRDEERTSLLVALPRRGDDARLLRPAAVVDHLLDAVVFADVEVPGVAGRVTAFRRILYRDQLGRAVAQRQGLDAFVLYIGAGVPVNMQSEHQPILVVDETRIDFVLHIGRLAV